MEEKLTPNPNLENKFVEGYEKEEDLKDALRKIADKLEKAAEEPLDEEIRAKMKDASYRRQQARGEANE